MSNGIRVSLVATNKGREMAAHLGGHMVAMRRQYEGWTLPASSNEAMMGQTQVCPLIVNILALGRVAPSWAN